MAFPGFLALGGIELVNQERVQAYLRNLIPGAELEQLPGMDTIHYALGDEEYRAPLLDDADWVDVDDTATHGFLGLYALDIEGLDDSTMQAPVTESVLYGGTTGAARDGTRSIRVHGYLVGRDELSMQAGRVWLSNALRSSGCGMHDSLCGASDLRYFLARPDVCVPIFGDFNHGENELMGTVDPTTSPLIYQAAGVDPATPTRATWVYQQTDGVAIRWGALELGDPTVLEEHGPIVIRRSNFITNPTFRTSTTGWTETLDNGASTGPVRVPAGGRTFARVGNSLQTINSNWLPDPSFEHGDPNSTGWRGSDDLTSPTDGTAPQGSHVLVCPARAGGNYVEASVLGPYDDAVLGVLSFWKLHASNLTVTVADNLGNQVFSTVLTGLAEGWARVSIPNIPVRVNYVVRIASAGTQEIRADGFLLETDNSTTAGTYFDGDTAAGGGLTFSWPDGYSGPSRSVTAKTNTEVELFTGVTDAPAGAVTLTFDMRATNTAPSVIVEMLDLSNTVVASTTIQPGHLWARYAVVTHFGRKVKVRFRSNARFDLDNVLLEGGAIQRDYFDGASIIPTDYTGGWLGAPDASISRIDWTGSTMISLNQSFRPYLAVDQGTLAGVVMEIQWAAEIPIETQLVPYDRYLHDVACTVGLHRINEYRTANMSVMEVDFILTAGSPRALGPQVQVYFDPSNIPDTRLYSDNRLNIASNPSGEWGTTGWNAIPGTGGTAAITNPTATTTFGTKVLRCTWSVASTAAGGGAYLDVPVVAGYAYSFQLGLVRPSIANLLQFQVEWRTATTSISTVSGAATAFTAAQSQALSLLNQIAPATATVARLKVVSVAGTGYANWSLASALDLDGVIACFGIGVPTWFSGDTPSTAAYDYSWDGTKGASTSRRAPHVNVVDPLVDPNIPVIPSPPLPPSITNVSITPQNEWRRYYGEIPASDIALWAETIPTVQLATKTQSAHQVRVRFYPNPFSWAPHDVDPTSYCSEFLLSYLPANSILTVFGPTEDATAVVPGHDPVAANHLLYGTAGAPMTWPALSCALPYLFTVDVPPDFLISNLVISMYVNNRE